MRGIALGCVLAIGLGLSTRSTAGAGREPGASESRLTTLLRHDPLRCAVSLATGEDAHVFAENYVRNRAGDLDFGSINADAFTIGIEGGRRGVIIDLGSSEDLAKRFGYVDPIGLSGQGYASIHYAGGALLITRAAEGTFQPVAESRLLTGTPIELATVPVVVGHVYLTRIVDARDPAFERIAKILVVAHVANESVTIRWDLLAR